MEGQIRGCFIPGLDTEELNTIPEFEMSDKKEVARYKKYMGTIYSDSEWFRKTCVERGYRLLYLYPIYYQGWEMDQWGGLGLGEDGKTYILETNHGHLRPREYSEGDIVTQTMEVLKIKEET